MTEEGAAAGYEIVLLLPRGAAAVVASTGDAEDRLSLPCIAVEGEPGTSSILAAIAGFLGDGPPPTLRIVPLTDPGKRPGLALVELEPLPEPADGRVPGAHGLTWRRLTASLAGSAEPEQVRPYLGRWLAELEGTATEPGRPSWSRSGWLARASAWMADRLDAIGSPLVAAPELHALWGLSAVIRGETADGSFFRRRLVRSVLLGRPHARSPRR